MLHYFSSQDMMISHTLARRFFWKEFILFKDDLPSALPLTVTLSGKDIIVPTKDVWDYLTDAARPERNGDDPVNDVEWRNDHLKVCWFANMNHAGVFNSKGARRGTATMVLQQCAKVDQST